MLFDGMMQNGQGGGQNGEYSLTVTLTSAEQTELQNAAAVYNQAHRDSITVSDIITDIACASVRKITQDMQAGLDRFSSVLDKMLDQISGRGNGRIRRAPRMQAGTRPRLRAQRMQICETPDRYVRPSSVARSTWIGSALRAMPHSSVSAQYRYTVRMKLSGKAQEAADIAAAMYNQNHGTSRSTREVLELGVQSAVSSAVEGRQVLEHARKHSTVEWI